MGNNQRQRQEELLVSDLFIWTIDKDKDVVDGVQKQSNGTCSIPKNKNHIYRNGKLKTKKIRLSITLFTYCNDILSEVITCKPLCFRPGFALQVSSTHP